MSVPSVEDNYLNVVEFLGKSLSIFRSHIHYTQNFNIEFKELLQIGQNLQTDYTQLISRSTTTSKRQKTLAKEINSAKKLFARTVIEEPIDRLQTIWNSEDEEGDMEDEEEGEMESGEATTSTEREGYFILENPKAEPIEMTFEGGMEEDKTSLDSIENPEQFVRQSGIDQFVCESENKVQCSVPGCKRKMQLVKLRMHVGKHILKEQLPSKANLCGYCGTVGCKVGIEKRSGFGVGTTYGPKSDCKYWYRFNMNKSDKNKVVKSYPCSNRPVICEQCNGVYWSYNLAVHYQSSHRDIPCPEQVTTEERTMMLKS